MLQPCPLDVLRSFIKTQGDFRAARWDVQKLAKTQKLSGPQARLRVLFALRPQNVIKAERNIAAQIHTRTRRALRAPNKDVPNNCPRGALGDSWPSGSLLEA